jgi:hypothetical protein
MFLDFGVKFVVVICRRSCRTAELLSRDSGVDASQVDDKLLTMYQVGEAAWRSRAASLGLEVVAE